MHGAIGVAKKNFRRAGIPATIKGKPNLAYAAVIGPTMERLAKAGGHFTVGDDRQGTRIYHFHDATIDRMYSRLTRRAKTIPEQDALRREYVALMKYKHHWVNAGKEATVSSIDLNSIFASNPSTRAGMPMAARQVEHDRQYRAARDLLGHKPGIVVDNVMCAETSLEVAGFSVGYNSRTQARDMAEKVLRESARKLAKLWGIG